MAGEAETILYFSEPEFLPVRHSRVEGVDGLQKLGLPSRIFYAKKYIILFQEQEYFIKIRTAAMIEKQMNTQMHFNSKRKA